MHELALCQALMDQVDRVARDQSAARVVSIHLGIGPLSGVEPGLLSQAFPIASAGSLAADAELVITSLPVVVHCQECGCQSEVQPTRLLCTHCGAWQTTLVSGDEMLLERVEVICEKNTPMQARRVLHS
ncbi:MAG TPA: hydrogenase maturation nickel metallochaperone HypA [Gammaproteobacteria bacterium]|jgi:hydrogenase nickel incorporation protein HypA/HybF|nr:hydrogenase maturation nickel metallochaperone HypA [Gammaproteobacteria bacterium]